MGALDLGFSRISKLLVDRDQVSIEAALARRQRFAVSLLCGDDVASSHTLQLAVLTAASIATRCFPGSVYAIVSSRLAEAPLLVWPSLQLTFGQALSDIVGSRALTDATGEGRALIFGNAPLAKGALRVTFDGWIAKVGPVDEVARLPEREYCSLAGVLAAGLALSELFLAFAEINIQATRRVVGFSLWRPDLDFDAPGAHGVPVEYLPRELWLLGLGHLGNSYLWALASLPYLNPGETELVLNDFDKVEHENLETGVIFVSDDVRHLKSRACCSWLQRRGFRTRLVERRFDETFRRHEKEPGLALCGFDSNPARRDLGTARFLRVIESGLGATAGNFDTISFHTLPNLRTPLELWPDLSAEEQAKRVQHRQQIARDNPGYRAIGGDDCGRFELAGKAVGVPFVGLTAASLVVAEAVRLLHNGPAYFDIKLGLGSPGKRFARRSTNYTAQDATLETLARKSLQWR